MSHQMSGRKCKRLSFPRSKAHLVGGAHSSIEDVQGHTHQSRVGNPGTIVPSPHLPLLVCLHLHSNLADEARHLAEPGHCDGPSSSRCCEERWQALQKWTKLTGHSPDNAVSEGLLEYLVSATADTHVLWQVRASGHELQTQDPSRTRCGRLLFRATRTSCWRPADIGQKISCTTKTAGHL